MAVREVLQFGNPLSRETATGVREVQDPAVQRTTRDLEDTLLDLQRLHGMGGGLAAPQIGSSMRIVFVNTRGRTFFLLNPEIFERSDEMFLPLDDPSRRDARTGARR